MPSLFSLATSYLCQNTNFPTSGSSSVTTTAAQHTSINEELVLSSIRNQGRLLISTKFKNSILMQLRQIFILYVSVLICLVSSLGGGAILPDSEVQALREIANSLGKTNWDFSVDPCSEESGWVTPNPEEGFENAVSCNCTYENKTVCHVIKIVLKRQNLPGILPLEVAKLSFLAELDLTRNYLNGSIPKEWGSLPLVKLSLIANRISGSIPIEFTNITTLQTFELVSNRLSGPLPPEIGNMTNIKKLTISSNYFSGPLPETLARLTNLEDFRISGNQFTGKIPSFIQNWRKLVRLEIQASGLQGPIPSEISFLTKLTDLRISDLNGTDADFPALTNMNSMEKLSNYNLTGAEHRCCYHI